VGGSESGVEIDARLLFDCKCWGHVRRHQWVRSGLGEKEEDADLVEAQVLADPGAAAHPQFADEQPVMRLHIHTCQ
jgi:hypothetical protein